MKLDICQEWKLVNQLTINYLNLNLPEWNTHAGLGFKADPFLMMSFFENYKYFENNNYNSSEALRLVYKNINTKYLKFQQNYRLEFSTYANHSFFNNYIECHQLENLDLVELEKKYLNFVSELKKEIVFNPQLSDFESFLN